MLPLRKVLGIPPSRSQKALIASAEVLEAAQDRLLNLNNKLAISNEVRAAWMQFQSASYGYMYGHQPAVRAVVDYIATNVTELGPKLYKYEDSTTRKEQSDHPAAETLREPNPWTPGRQFIFDMFADYLVYNNAYALKVRPVGEEKKLYLLSIPASSVGILGQGVYQLSGYQIFRRDGTNFTVPPGDMLHWRGYNATDRAVGISKLETLRAELAEQAATQRANVDLMESGLQQRGYIKRPLEAPDWRKDGGKERFIEQFRAAMKRADRGYPVLEEGMEIAPLGVSPKDAEMLSSRQLFNDEVAAQYGMVHCPPEGEEERRQFYADVLPPICGLFCDFLRQQLLQDEFFVNDYYFEFSLDKKQMSDNRLQALTSAAGVPPLLRNEVRAMLNLPPVKGGDEPVTPANVMAGTKPSTGVMPPQDPNGPPQDGSHRLDQAPPKPALPAKGAEMYVDPETGERYISLREIAEKAERATAVGVSNVSPADKQKLRYLAEHYLGMAHPFTSCVRDQVKHGLSDDHAKRRCAVLLDAFDPKRLRHSRPKGLDDELLIQAFVEGDTEMYVKFNPNQPRDRQGRWTDTGGGGLSDPNWTSSGTWATGDVNWDNAAQGEDLLRGPATPFGPYQSPSPTAPSAAQQRRDAEANRRELAKRNPDMEVVDTGIAFELKPKKEARKYSREELQKRNPDWQPPGDSLIHRIDRFLNWEIVNPGVGGRRNPRRVGARSLDRNIDRATAVLLHFYDRQRRVLEKKALDGKGFDAERWDRELAEDLAGLFDWIIDREGGIAAARLGADDFDVGRVQSYIKATAEALAVRINEATREDLERGVDESEKRARLAGATIGTKATEFAVWEANRQALTG